MRLLVLFLCLLGTPNAKSLADDLNEHIDILWVKDQAGRECFVGELVEVRLAIHLPTTLELKLVKKQYLKILKNEQQKIKNNPDLNPNNFNTSFIVEDPTWFHIIAWAYMNQDKQHNVDIGHSWIEINTGDHMVQWEFSPYSNCFGWNVNDDFHLGRIQYHRQMKSTHTLPMLLGPESIKNLYKGFATDITSRLVFHAFDASPGRNCFNWAANSLLSAGVKLPRNLGKINELSIAVKINGNGLKWIDHRPTNKTK